MNKTIKGGARHGAVNVPSSKSQAHRALICAALSDKPCEVSFRGASNDIVATSNCLSALGAEIAPHDGGCRVIPISRPRADEVILRPGESGSTLRFLLPLVGALGASARFVMEGRLGERPMDALTSQLMAHGMVIGREGDSLTCLGKLTSGVYTLPGDVSSQFVSGLLFALPLLDGDSEIRLTGAVESRAYITMTENAISGAGIRFEKGESSYHIYGNQRYRAGERIDVEGDWSNAAFFLCMGALSNKGVSVSGLDATSAQGDKAVLEILGRAGAKIDMAGGKISVSKGELKPRSIDASMIPDLVPTLAALCALCRGESRITNAARLRFKESDRLRTTSAMLSALGAQVTETADGLIIDGTGRLDGGRVDAAGDHRIAMAAAVAACGCESDVEIIGAECVSKSYPAFFDDFECLEAEA